MEFYKNGISWKIQRKYASAHPLDAKGAPRAYARLLFYPSVKSLTQKKVGSSQDWGQAEGKEQAMGKRGQKQGELTAATAMAIQGEVPPWILRPRARCRHGPVIWGGVPPWDPRFKAKCRSSYGDPWRSAAANFAIQREAPPQRGTLDPPRKTAKPDASRYATMYTPVKSDAARYDTKYPGVKSTHNLQPRSTPG